MLPRLARRCPERTAATGWRYLTCHANPEQRWCGRQWITHGPQQLADAIAEREAHQAICLGNPADALRTALPGRR